jgi:CBS domain-containing protein
MAAADPSAYLRATAPFGALPQALFDEAARTADVAYHPAGTWLVRAGGQPLRHLYVIRKGSVRLERDGQTLQVLEEGEVFGYTSLISRKANLDVQVEDDLVAFRIPDDVFQALLRDARFARHFADALSDRLKASLAQSPVATFRPDLGLEVGQIVRDPPVWVDAGATVGEAARAMRAAHATAVLVRGTPPAIVTDRDFRNRVLAEGLGPDAPISAVATPAPRTVRADTRIHEAWTALLDAGGHHLPVERDGEVVAVLGTTDLLRCTAQGPMAVLRRVERLSSRASLPGYAATLAEMSAALLAGGLDAIQIAGFVARLNDTLVARVIRLAEADLGPAPAPWAWLALGSEGRAEQTLLTDQDNALVHADGVAPAAAEWYARFAERVNADLEVAGFPRCAAGYMARRWTAPLSEWAGRFAGWIDAPSPDALVSAGVFFDFRRVAGGLDLGPLEAALASAPRKPPFLRFLAKAALDFHPPGALLVRLKGSSSVDLKAHGIAPVVFLARCYGLELGGAPRGTLARLEAAVRAGNLAEDEFAEVAEAYRFLVGLRLRDQLRSLAAGAPARSAVAPGELGALERTRLKDALRAVRGLQEAGALHFKTAF